MQLAILVGTNPSTALTSARVRLKRGDWIFKHEGLVDSILALHVLTPHAELENNHQEYELSGSKELPLITVSKVCMIYIEWKHRGTEKSINLVAKLHEDASKSS